MSKITPFFVPFFTFISLSVPLISEAEQSVSQRNEVSNGINKRALEARAMFDMKTGDGAIDFVINSIPQEVFDDVSSSGGDASLVLRFTTLLINSWFDASAPYHPTAIGVYSDLGRRPAEESVDNENINIALIYASYHVLNSLLPKENPLWRQMMMDAGLDPDNANQDLSSPIGIGNVAGKAVVSSRENDGMNQLGNEKDLNSKQDIKYNFTAYRDYTNYIPQNTPDKLSNPSRWQPDIVRRGAGIYRTQRFATPQYALVTPYSYANASDFVFPAPTKSQISNVKDYKQQAADVLKASAMMTDDQKLKSELFDSKINSLIGSVLFTSAKQKLSLLEKIHLQFTTSVATFDAGIVVWQEKTRFDAVRPFSAIYHLYGDKKVTAWGGPGKGTVTNLPANQWKSYLQTADHPEYPSASACFCNSHAQAARKYTGTDDLGFFLKFKQGQSRIEPGLTPAKDTTITLNTWSDFAKDCGQSRAWSGVHFQASIDASEQSCRIFGDMAHDYVDGLIKGKKVSRKDISKKYQKAIKSIGK